MVDSSQFLKKWNLETDRVIEVDEETSILPLQSSKVMNHKMTVFFEGISKKPSIEMHDATKTFGKADVTGSGRERPKTTMIKVVPNNITVPLQVPQKQARLPFSSTNRVLRANKKRNTNPIRCLSSQGQKEAVAT